MDIEKVKIGKNGKLYIQYGKKGGIVYGKFKDCPACHKKFFASNAQIQRCKENFCSKKCRGKIYSGSKHPMWKNGYTNVNGYRVICMNGKPYYEHRAIMEQSIGRKLERWEVVHHKNHTRIDNRIENLELYPNTHNFDGISQAKKEIARLKCLLKQHNISF